MYSEFKGRNEFLPWLGNILLNAINLDLFPGKTFIVNGIQFQTFWATIISSA